MGVKTWRQWTGPEVTRLRQLLQQGMSSVYIAEVLGRTRWSVQNKAQEIGVSVAKPSENNFTATTLPEHYVVAVRALAREGLTHEQICTIFKQRHRANPENVRRMCAGLAHKEDV